MPRRGSRRSGFGGTSRRSYGNKFSFFGNNNKSRSPPKKSILKSNIKRKIINSKKEFKLG